MKCAGNIAWAERIIGIRVEAGDKVFNVDLEKSRAWGYILEVITKNGGRAEMTVSIKQED